MTYPFIVSVSARVPAGEEMTLLATTIQSGQVYAVQFTGDAERFELSSLRFGTRNAIASPHAMRLGRALRLTFSLGMHLHPGVGASATVRNVSAASGELCVVISARNMERDYRRAPYEMRTGLWDEEP